ncbi:phosphoribosylanthranilate isomerase [Noviherbaspirillum pedocola]|uniref:N-(5'-phosphoribosyl)anthranilate isomerase n=1 Tax=Noviherbaspirillum pedocola TaxID=2801341 RepID=A0A934W6Y9_9BURK|nr:phosphoribosylanthranilate isomerase [Noviherbaspirillum pedocola]MBK4734079.1 phosphoribosylanthranilate isomerase [Noviherbaspirillum pedocola]
MNQRTRIKLCGLSQPQDVTDAVAAGADAIGLVFYPPSPRSVPPQRAAELMRGLSPFVAAVGLFVNPSIDEVKAAVDAANLSLLQFHGDETPEQCHALASAVGRPFLKAFRVRPDTAPDDLLEYDRICRAHGPLYSALLLDTWVDAYGGGGKVFDWSLIPEELAPRVVLSGGLSAQNVTEAVRRIRPYAVDVSSGIERAKGVKDGAMMRAFVDAVRRGDGF